MRGSHNISRLGTTKMLHDELEKKRSGIHIKTGLSFDNFEMGKLPRQKK